MSKTILLSSLKGGVGKTTVCAALAFALAYQSKRVLCVDLDSGVRALDLVLGAQDLSGRDVSEVLENALSPAAESSRVRENLWFLPAPIRNTQTGRVDEAALARFLQHCRAEFDYTFLDLPAGGGEYFLPLARSPELDEAIVVTTSDLAALRAAEQTGYELRECGTPTVRLILNRCPETRRELSQGLYSMTNLAGIPVLGVIPEDPIALRAQGAGVTLSELPQSKAGTALWNIAARLEGKRVPLMQNVLPKRRRNRLYRTDEKKEG